MSELMNRFVQRRRTRSRRRAPAGIGVRFPSSELVRHAGPTQMVLSSHDPRPPRTSRPGR